MKIVRPESVGSITGVAATPLTRGQKAKRAALSIGWALLVLFGVVVAVVVGAFGLYMIGASKVSGLYGMCVGMFGFVVWSSRRV